MLDRILVTGATGQIGREIAKGLLERGADVTVMDSGAGRVVLGVPHVKGNFAEPDSLRRAFAGFDVVFLLSPLVPKKLQFARAAVDAAHATGVRHIVRSSGAGADKDKSCGDRASAGRH